MQEVISYVEQKAGKKAVFSAEGLKGPYNGQNSFSLDTIKAKKLGYEFTELKGWIYELLDKYISKAINHI